MKDDFYKDINHKRASDDKKAVKSKNEPHDKKDEPSLSRAERHRQKKKKTTLKGQQQGTAKNLTSYINRENINKQKTFFLDKFSSYKKRFKNEISVSKKKLGELKARRLNSTKDKRHDENDQGKRRLWPIIVAGVLILPVTIALGALITSNFWPDDPPTQIADQSEESSEESVSESRKELEEKKAKKEKEAAQAQKSESEEDEAEEKKDDLDTGTSDFSYSEDQEAELEDAAASAIDQKEDGEADDSPDSTVAPPTEEETTQEADEESSEEIGTYTVRPDDNLYRIAIRYYGEGTKENIDKIREANGVDDRGLSVGQELVIPE